MMSLQRKLARITAAVLVFIAVACAHDTAPLDAAKPFANADTLTLLETLSSDAMQGRAVSTPGNAAARQLILDRFSALDLAPLPGSKSLQQPFVTGDFADRSNGKPSRPGQKGVNLIGTIEGRLGDAQPILVVSAHYDHLGVQDGQIFNGADDNASGVAGMLAIAEYFTANPPQYSVWFIAFDAEEDGLRGARHFVRTLRPELQARIGINLNLDMISRGDNDLLWASGVAHWPHLKPIVRKIAAIAPVSLRMGFDTGDGYDNWTELSDHGPFYRAGIPHLYLGVEDHPDYHKPSDDFAKIDQAWYLDSVTTSIMMAAALERNLPELQSMRAD